MRCTRCLQFDRRVSAGIGAVLLTLVTAPAAARDRAPLPDPLPCPIDAPLRIASQDTLKHFDMTMAACDATATIVAPAIALPTVEPVIRIEPVPRMHRTGEQPRVVERATPPGPVAAANVMTAPPLSDDAILALRPRSYRTAFDATIAAAAARHRVDPLLLHAVITQESAYRPSAVSHAGARGLMQVMPGTGAMLGTRAAALFDPATNINTGAKLLRRIWTRFGGRFDLVLAAYNAGDGAVIKYGYRVPPYRETQGYVARVRAVYARLAAESSLAIPGL